MVNSDKVRTIVHFICTTVDALHRAHDALMRKRFDEPDCAYITQQLDRANDDFLFAVREWERLAFDLRCGKGGAA